MTDWTVRGLEVKSQAERSVVYTPAERMRRDRTIWTLVQGVLAPAQFLVFLVSLVLVLRYLLTGNGLEAAGLSVLIKTAVLLLIMVTGAIWEKVVFGQYLFARPFFWEDVVSMMVIAAHLAVAMAWFDWGLHLSPQSAMLLALLAYSLYLINAAQFLRKLRLARLEARNA
ncbi:MAG: 2-vinyl bacteriochlorophyllide hydratase [Burkholderiaceae bacterium]